MLDFSVHLNLTKMKILSVHQNILAWLRVFSFAETDRRTQRLSKVFAVFILSAEMLSLTSSVFYLYENMFKTTGDDLGTTLYALTQLGGWGCNLYTLIVAYMQRDKLRSIFDKLQEIYDG